MSSINQVLDRLSMITIINSIPDELMKKCEGALDEIGNLAPSDRVAFNFEVAKFNGVTVDALIASPNMDKLIGFYVDDLFRRSTDVLINVGASKEQAFAIIRYLMTENIK